MIRAPRQQWCHLLAASARHEGGGAVIENRFFMMFSIGLCRIVLAISRAAVSSFNARESRDGPKAAPQAGVERPNTMSDRPEGDSHGQRMRQLHRLL
jgi:hypothetical protein